NAYNVILSYRGSTWEVDIFDELPEGVQPPLCPEELGGAEEAVRRSPLIRKLAAEVGITEPEQIASDGWSIGYDDRFPEKRRVQQGMMFARTSKDDNLYAHPMDFVPVLDTNTGEVLQIDFPPKYIWRGKEPVLTAPTTAAPPLSDAEKALAASGRERILPPMKNQNFLPDLVLKDNPDFKYRTDIKPLHITQPEGVSFALNGHELTWQKWKMHVAHSQREGIALSTITYNDNGEVRPIIYRLSLAEMVVPYAAPEHAHPRKFAFDAGEYGMGCMANDLSLGCDCLGQIYYLPGTIVAMDGKPRTIKHAICIHEEDAGVLWKHGDYRPGGRSHTTRRRRLVISMVCTLANYEYIWNYLFYQDGTIEFEVRLTGILNSYVATDNEPDPYGTTVSPNIIAQHHQHLMSLRIDPMLDGLANSVIESDVIPLPNAPTGSKANFAGNAFIAQDSPLKVEVGRPYDYEKERRWKIVNNSRKHPSSGKAVGFAIGLKGATTPLMARWDSWVSKRAPFVQETIWVIRDVEGKKGSRMWPAGKYVPQTRIAPEDSIKHWENGRQSIVDEDILVFVTAGITHIPRPEDWPVMPSETLSVTLKPNGFFTENPSMDVPGTFDQQSVYANVIGRASGEAGIAGGTVSGPHECH
ncbi:hypothetical protein H0H87_001591, partial [Tephrocybe sp. NHM501043]